MYPLIVVSRINGICVCKLSVDVVRSRDSGTVSESYIRGGVRLPSSYTDFFDDERDSWQLNGSEGTINSSDEVAKISYTDTQTVVVH